MFDSMRLLDTILDRMLGLLPAEPAALKRLDDIGDPEPYGVGELHDVEEPQITESGYPESGVHATSSATATPAAGQRAAAVRAAS